MIDIRHWLLDAAVEFPVPLQILGASNVGDILNRKPHGLATADLTLRLEELIESGEIEISKYADGEVVWRHPGREEIARLVAEDRWVDSEP